MPLLVGCWCRSCVLLVFCVFFFNDTATTEIYTLSLHDALPIWLLVLRLVLRLERLLVQRLVQRLERLLVLRLVQRRSEEHTSELQSRETISYAVFCLKKKKK